MRVNVQFFAHMGDIAGCREKAVELPAGARIDDLAAYIVQDDARFAPGMSTCRFAVNDEWAPRDAQLAGGDTVAIVPPVSGG